MGCLLAPGGRGEVKGRRPAMHLSKHLCVEELAVEVTSSLLTTETQCPLWLWDAWLCRETSIYSDMLMGITNKHNKYQEYCASSYHVMLSVRATDFLCCHRCAIRYTTTNWNCTSVGSSIPPYNAGCRWLYLPSLHTGLADTLYQVQLLILFSVELAIILTSSLMLKGEQSRSRYHQLITNFGN